MLPLRSWIFSIIFDPLFSTQYLRYVYDDIILCIAFPNNSLLTGTIANKLSGHKNPATFLLALSKNMAYL